MYEGAKNASAATHDDAEARLRALLDSAVEGMLTITDRGIIEAVNPAVLRIFGYREEELVGQNVKLLMAEPERSAHDQYLDTYQHTGQRHIIGGSREVLAKRKDGTIIPVELSVGEYRVHENAMFVGILRDVSAKKEAEQQREAAVVREAYLRGRMEFAVSVLHDLGNVLTGVFALSAELRLGAVDPTLEQHLQRLHRWSEQHSSALGEVLGERSKALRALLQALEEEEHQRLLECAGTLEKLQGHLDHAQELLSAQRSGVSVAVYADVDRVLCDLERLGSSTVGRRGGVLVVEKNLRVPKVRLEPWRLLQVLLNLVENASEALVERSDHRRPLVLLRVESDGSSVCFVVQDEGHGIAKGCEEQCFEEGYTTRARGSGVGLALCRRLVTRVGGSLTLSSEGEGCGATARLLLPAVLEGEDAG